MPEASTALSELMARWALHQFLADQLKAEIEPLVLALGHTVETADARATWSEGRGSYDWEGLARALKAPKDVLRKYAEVKVDWRAVCLEVGVPEALLQRYYTPAPDGPRVRLSRR